VKFKFRPLQLLPLFIWLLPFFAQTAFADTQPGLTYTVWDNRTGQNNQYNVSPPLPPTTPIIATGVAPRIEYQFGGGPIFGTNISEDVVVKFEGWIDPPTDQMYYLCVASDDGAKMYLDGVNVINDWYDRGGGCGQTADVDFSNGQPKQMTVWYYENGGGAHVTLLYYTGNGWAAAPDSWFTIDQPVVTTTTTSTTTTTTTTTTHNIVNNDHNNPATHNNHGFDDNNVFHDNHNFFNDDDLVNNKHPARNHNHDHKFIYDNPSHINDHNQRTSSDKHNHIS
jgi:hypothetical protein